MCHLSSISRRIAAALLLLATSLAGNHSASAATAAFWLNGITYSNTSGLFGITTGDGLITWTYTPGDFANGTGHYIYVNLPPYTVPPYYATTYDVTTTQITGQLANANVDTYWYDWMITFAPALATPNSTAHITGGSYDLTGSNPDFGFYGNFLGQIVGGTVSPYQPTLALAPAGTNLVVSWPTNYADGFKLQTTTMLGAAAQWKTSSIPVIVGTNYVVTNVVAGSSNTFFRLVR